MPTLAWVLVAVYAASTLATIANVGKPRDSLSPGMAVAITVCNGLMVWAIVALAT